MGDKKALIICDAWKNLSQEDLLNHPNLSKDCKAFAVFLNRVCELEREKGTQIIHAYNHDEWSRDKECMDEINILEADYVAKGDLKEYLLKNKFEEVFWAGFHFGRCIHARSYFLHPHIQCKIVINLCLVFPQDNWQQTFIGGRIKDPFKKYSLEEEKILTQAHQEKQYYLWCNQGFDRIELI
tara:strand:+ start:535 stop:1083 length:549 start_codon:yes stop_codon:yes gene_type:complete